MSRQHALVVLGLALAVAGALRLWWRARPADAAAFDCPPAALGLDDAGLVRCGGRRPLPVGQALTVGQRFDLNRASADDLALVPGLGAEVAERLVSQRPDGGYRDWAQVDAVEGIGPARLETLQRVAEVRGAEGL